MSFNDKDEVASAGAAAEEPAEVTTGATTGAAAEAEGSTTGTTTGTTTGDVAAGDLSSEDAFNDNEKLANEDEEYDGEQSPYEQIDQDNILAQYSEDQAISMGKNYARKNELDQNLFGKAAAVARNPVGFNRMNFLSQQEKEALNFEQEHPNRLPFQMWYLIVVCSMGAAVQGMDESVINGADLFWPTVFGIGSDSERDTWLEGLVNSAPYLACSCISCWLTDPLNKLLGRKWTIFISCGVSALACFWQGFVNTWWHLFIARFFLGFGIGPKSATIPVYAAECSPARIRGSLVMMWQTWTAFGIMFGYVMTLAFYYVPSRGIGEGLNWRLILASAMLPAVICCAQIWQCPESPRWLMGRDRHADAFNSLKVLRNHELIAARDCFYQYLLFLEEESYGMSYLQKCKDLFIVRRNRNATFASWILMFMQQFCGINVIAYYSSSIFVKSGFSVISAMIASWGYGMISFVFVIPALLTIDSFGRRNLLLFAFPLMSGFLLMTGFAFWIPDDHEHAKVGVICLGIYLFAIVYASSEGPVPFTYSAECHQLAVRDVGMSFATATCWFFNFILSLTWPAMLEAFSAQGAFGWYAAWNAIGFFLVLWFVPETKNLTLEELDDVFSVNTYSHAMYQTRKLLYNFKVHILRKTNVETLPPLYKQHRMAVTNATWEDKGDVEYIE
ncbi:hypothetical protein PACTADRAFT_185445 [Pachysolen tannophilus NRRL Y-2460]|uniref:Major facilitator superfamily (MFS) profile domain-containing protein n=1 Tax=Pachysolen tannophilus NRRL Y-2460 TaxID=669874 RepID=A0A1E4U2B2_PACTA|nr:hypothetical protein PACTADRAFT_185445 [Pachysolen tannophilus NRRL Y-2460]